MSPRLAYGAIGLAILALVAVASGLAPRIGANPDSDPAGAVPAGQAPTAGAPRNATLYCEFFNFSDRNPRVGFHFAIEEARPSPVYSQIFRREGDGTQTDYGRDGAPRPAWSFLDAENPASIRSPDDETGIVLYDYDAKHAGTTWFEAGLRSNDYKNLGGKCRLSAT